MTRTKRLLASAFLMLSCILFTACSQNKEVDFVKKYKVDSQLLFWWQ